MWCGPLVWRQRRFRVWTTSLSVHPARSRNGERTRSSSGGGWPRLVVQVSIGATGPVEFRTSSKFPGPLRAALATATAEVVWDQRLARPRCPEPASSPARSRAPPPPMPAPGQMRLGRHRVESSCRMKSAAPRRSPAPGTGVNIESRRTAHLVSATTFSLAHRLRRDAPRRVAGRALEAGRRLWHPWRRAAQAVAAERPNQFGGAARAPTRVASPTGCGAVWLARLTGGQEVGGSNPLSPTMERAGSLRKRWEPALMLSADGTGCQRIAGAWTSRVPTSPSDW